MKKNSTLESRLAKYTAVAGAVVAGVTSADAQIVYNDINPDVTVTGHQQGVTIDMNGSVDDFVVVTFDTSGSYTTYGFTVTYSYKGSIFAAETGNSWIMNGTATDEVANLASGVAVNSAAAWSTNTASGGGLLGIAGTYDVVGLPYGGPISAGAWLGANQRFVGVKFSAGANTHYGWVRMTVSADGGTVTIHDLAYNSTNNGAINTGQTVGVQNDLSGNVSISNVNNNVVVRVNGDVTNGTASIMTLDGKQVATFSLQNGFNEYSLDALAAGIYVVTTSFDQGVATKKVFVR